MTSEPPLPIEDLLAQTDWVTSLARALVADPTSADDVAQATWADVLRSPPRGAVDLRAWLAVIVRRKAQRVRRTDSRRTRREQIAAAARASETAPSAAELAVRIATHRQLVDAVLALDEPYRETVVLRFFENLGLEAIAERTHSKHNTVRSRLQRGLQQLRERLDRGPGARQGWLPAVLALGQRRLTTELTVGTGGMAAGIALAITMKKYLLGAVALAAGLLFALPLLLPDPAGVAPDLPERAIATADATATTPAPGSGAANPRAEAERSEAPAAANPPMLAPRSLVDRLGRPLANVVVRAESPFAVRWQGGDRGWISSPERSLRISPEDEARLRTDAGFAQQFFGGFDHPDEWRATVLDAPLPAREVRTGPDGAFVFAAELGVKDAAITIGDPTHVLIAAGATGKQPWTAGPAARVTGTVRDSDGKPLADQFVMPICPLAEGAVELHGQSEVRTDDNGAFLVRKALANGMLRVGHAGFETAFVPVGSDPVQHLDIVLRRRITGAPRQIDGLVVDVGGRPIADAAVWFGRKGTRTTADGRFALPADGIEPQHALTIAAKGHALFQQEDFGAAAEAANAQLQDLLFVLSKTPVTGRGLVLGSDGAPLAGALVGLLDPTLLDISFESVEARIGGWSGGVATAADGTFSLAGLGERTYRFRAVDPGTGAIVTSAPVRPDAGEVVLRLPQDLRRIVRGRVLVDGDGVPGAKVEIGYCTHITKGGGTQFDSAPAVECDAQGCFVLPVLPRQGAWLCVRLGSSLRHMVPVEALPAHGEVTIVVDDQRWLQLVGSGSATARTIHFELAEGRCVATDATLAPNGDAPVLPIPADAVAVVIDRGRPTARRMQLTEDRAVLLRVR